MPSKPSSDPDEGEPGIRGDDPVFPDLVAPLTIDLLDDGEPVGRCAPPDPRALEPLPGRVLVAYEPSLEAANDVDDDADQLLARLGRIGHVRWLYRGLRLAEVDRPQSQPAPGRHGKPDPPPPPVPGVVGVVPAWATVGTARGIVVGLGAVCAFAERQAGDPDAFYRHHPGIGYPVIRTDGDRPVVDLDPSIDLPTPPALVPVVNVSIGTTRVPYPTAPNDIVNLATAAASAHVLVVIAAGNCGAAADDAATGDTMSAWARPDWVLSVGATRDEAGTVVADYSSRGGPGPDLVAYGASALNEAKVGTSFAAPRVSALARLVVAAFCELGRELMAARGEPAVGVPAVGFAIIDSFTDEIWDSPAAGAGIQALPLVGVRPDVAATIAATTGASLRVRTTPAIMREVLLSAARPVPGADASCAGAGFVDEPLVIERLASLTVADLWAWFGHGPRPDDEHLLALRPFDPDGLVHLAGAVRVTGPTLRLDYRTGRWASLPAPDDLVAANPRGLPVDLTGIRL
ncbi:subtilase family protein [Salana multivorans]|uniref:Subtilase family protein n=1 Tax=Salana multivorans TaxID=120377 RepID=A0A3N2D0S3_9MICO|nr:S8/S53 family peptidase [Salana multivorans]ROR93380.1 subtilase family protein [Salana multivorans]